MSSRGPLDGAEPLLELLYPGHGAKVAEELGRLVARYAPAIARHGQRPRPDQTTAVLITYADAIDGPAGEPPLAVLHQTLRAHVGDAISDVHLLPMFPSTSDDGFAVSDYRNLDPRLGSWDDIATLAGDYRLMFDFVANHVSASHPWLGLALSGDPEHVDRFINFDPGFDTSRVIRPRTTPLFHDYSRPDGSQASLWTTFSADQVDLNFASPATLLALTEVLLGYLARGASSIRLDAIGFIWKQSATSCMHLPQTHAVVKLWRQICDNVRPGVQIITETNVPHAENVSYLGDGHDEAHQVYQFALPPLVLHSFVAGTATKLSQWAASIQPASDTATYLNFLATHDGIGLRPVEGMLDGDEIDQIVRRVLANDGLVSMKTNADGTQDVYELNINYLDALAEPDHADNPGGIAAKGLSAHCILLSLVGIPALYYHSLFGSAGDPPSARSSGINRRINRAHLCADTLGYQLSNDPRRHLVHEGLLTLLAVRQRHPAFSPYSPQRIDILDERVFAVHRGEGTSDHILCLANVSDQHVALPVGGTDLITGATHRQLTLPPFGYAWLSDPALTR